MLDVNGVYRCDAEIGSPRKGWRGCLRPACTGIDSRYGGELHYCDKHLHHIGNPACMTPKAGAETRALT